MTPTVIRGPAAEAHDRQIMAWVEQAHYSTTASLKRMLHRRARSPHVPPLIWQEIIWTLRARGIEP